MTSPSPTHLGPYRITARLAVGGMAEVFLARREGPDGFGRMVALKRLLPHLAEDPSVVQMFLNEARITAQLDHPNVVRILEVGEAEGLPFIAMELLEGGSFAQLREKAAESGQRVPLPIALRILIEACRGLDAAHRATDEHGRPLGIVHRDFTPDNIHVETSGQVKVLDFGIAKSAGTPGGTEPGTLKGKYFYMSPEMIAGEPLDHRADVFATGAMLYEQVCGHRPFTGNNTGEILARITQHAPKPPTEYDPSVPRSLEAVCLRALARRPEERFASLAELAFALESLSDVPIATPAEVGGYVDALFPRDQDERRLQLERARAMDPSLPPHPRPSGVPGLVTPKPHPRAAPVRAEETSSRGGLKKILLALALVAVAGGGWAWTHRPLGTPAQRLAEARKSTTPKKRLSLANLAEDPRATPEQLAEAGQLLLAVHADRAALTLAEALEARHPKSVEGHLIEARAATALRYGKRAESALETAARLAPSDPRPDEARADLKTLQGDLDGALLAIEAAARKAPTAPHWVVRRADLLVRLSRLDEARRVTSAALAHRFSPEVAAEKAFVDLQQGRTKDAHALLQRALRANDTLAPAHYYLGALLEAQGDTAAAEREYHAADRLDPEDVRALKALLSLAKAQHRDDEAKALSKALDDRTAEAD